MLHYCQNCDRTFGSQQALQQHRNSPAHVPVYGCDDCKRSFGSQHALQHHLDSPAHAPVYQRDRRSEIIRSSWGTWENFMLSYGLKPYNWDDVEEANAILDAFMKDD